MSDGFLEDTIAHYLWLVVSPLLLLVGTVGNTLSFVIMCRLYQRKVQSTVYLIALSVVDMVVLYTGLLRHLLRVAFSFEIRQISEIVCKLDLTLLDSSLHSSVWILVAFTFERVFSVLMPHKVKTYCSRASSFAAIAIIAVLLLALSSHYIFFVGLETSCQYIWFINNPSMNTKYGKFLKRVWPWINLFVYNVIPAILIIVGNTCIVILLMKSRKRISGISVAWNPSQNAPTYTSITEVHGPAESRAPNVDSSRTAVETIRRTRSSFSAWQVSSLTTILLVLSLVFLVTTTPVSIFFLSSYFIDQDTATPREKAILNLSYTIVSLFMYTNNAVNFFLYCFMGPRFRRELCVVVPLFRKRLRRAFSLFPVVD